MLASAHTCWWVVISTGPVAPHAPLACTVLAQLPRYAWACPVQAMGIQRFVFFSIHNAEKHPEVPLMLVKACTEKYLKQSGLDYTIFRLCGFMQVLALSDAFRASCEEVQENYLKEGQMMTSPLCCTGNHWQLRGAHPGGEAGLGHLRSDQDGLPRLPGAHAGLRCYVRRYCCS